MNIGIDIDGVLTYMEEKMIVYGTKMSVEENWPIQINVNEYDETKMFNWSEEQVIKFWNRYIISYFKNSEPREFAGEVIEKLIQENNRIYFITARNGYGIPKEYLGKEQEITIEWLKKHNIKYDKLIFASSEEKLEQCIKNKVDVMIEDSPQNIQNISKKIKVIKFDCQYNKHVNGENIITAYSWYHIYDIIKKLQKI